jgi:phthalate 4,5-dioxygenase oxygenase subunit
MLSQEENELLTRVGAGTPMGALMRRYWVPALFSNQIEKPDCPPVRVRLLSENLVAFRDSDGRPGLIDERCPHRTASLFFGRNEECGLRCVYHGWKFDVEGKCVDLPSEPPGSNFQDKISITAYPCYEQGGIVWTYMGPADLKPEFPALEWTLVPESSRLASRHLQECNWLQGLEGGFDTSHLAFLHKGSSQAPRGVPSRYEVIPKDFGFVVGTGRGQTDGEIMWTANVMAMPFHKIIATEPFGAHCWVPVDDHHTMLYSVDFRPDQPLTDDDLELSRHFRHIHSEMIPGTDHTVANKANNYLIDREVQASGASYTGMWGLSVQDCAVQESMGPVANRTFEHLGVSDTAIIQIRRLLLKAVKDLQDGGTPPGMKADSYRVRSARFLTPDNVAFGDVVDDRVALEAPAVMDALD